MAKDEGAGATDASPDEPSADELARRRAERKNDATEPNGKSVEDRAAAGDGEGGEGGEEDDGQFGFFELVEKGKRVTLSSLISRGTAINVEWKFEGKSARGRGGLIPFSDPRVLLLVDARAGKVEVDPTYDENDVIQKVTLRPHLKALDVMDARSEYAMVRLQGEPPSAAQG